MKKTKKKSTKIFCLFIIVIFGIILIKQQSIINRLNGEYKSYVLQKQNLHIQNQQLKEKLAKSQTNDYGETLAREKLGMIKEGEILFIDKNKTK
ncbi:MAG: septum formation initiator family protein [Clostridium sp.]